MKISDDTKIKCKIVGFLLYVVAVIVLCQAWSFYQLERILKHPLAGDFGISRWWDLLIAPITLMVTFLIGVVSISAGDHEEEELNQARSRDEIYALTVFLTIVAALFSLYYGVADMGIALAIIIPSWIMVVVHHYHSVRRRAQRRPGACCTS